MASPPPNAPRGSMSKHDRHSSAGRGAPQLPRRSLRGPLDLAQAPVSGPLGSPALSPSRSSLSPRSSLRSPLAIRSMSSPTHPTKDFSKLLRPEIYHPLPPTDIPAPLRPSSPPSQDLSTLLSANQFRAAAILAAQHLTTATSPDDPASIFNLLYIRLAALTLCNATALAAQEVKALEDLNSGLYFDDLTSAPLVPWELRVLAVRLQGIGFNDPRRGVMGYYDLARDARSELARLKAEVRADPGLGDARLVERQMWEGRLWDLGIRVASALVEMEDLAGAAEHLRALPEGHDRLGGARKALLWLKLGDVERARGYVGGGDGEEEFVLKALADMAEGRYGEAAAAWKGLIEREGGMGEGNEMWRQNLAVCLLYSGQIGEARGLLEGLVDKGTSFQALTFNLSTIYELCTDRSRDLKIQLAEKVAALPAAVRSGWEATNADFKL